MIDPYPGKYAGIYVVEAASLTYGRNVRFGGTEAYVPAYIEVGAYYNGRVKTSPAILTFNGVSVEESGAFSTAFSNLGYVWELDNPTTNLELSPAALADYIAKLERRGDDEFDQVAAAPVSDFGIGLYRPATPPENVYKTTLPVLTAYDIIFNLRFGAQTLANSQAFSWAVNKVALARGCYVSAIYATGDELHIQAECNPIAITAGLIVGIILAILGGIAIISWSVVRVSDNNVVITQTEGEIAKLDALKGAYDDDAITKEEYGAAVLDVADNPLPTGGGDGDGFLGGLGDFLKGDNFKLALGAVVVVALVGAFKK